MKINNSQQDVGGHQILGSLIKASGFGKVGSNPTPILADIHSQPKTKHLLGGFFNRERRILISKFHHLFFLLTLRRDLRWSFVYSPLREMDKVGTWRF